MCSGKVGKCSFKKMKRRKECFKLSGDGKICFQTLETRLKSFKMFQAEMETIFCSVYEKVRWIFCMLDGTPIKITVVCIRRKTISM